MASRAFPPQHPGSPKPSLTGLEVLSYTPSRWLKGQTAAKMLTRRARPKTKLLKNDIDDIVEIKYKSILITARLISIEELSSPLI
jgi:hypothetical protein